MGTTADLLYDGDHPLARRAIAAGPSWVRRAARVVQEGAEHTTLWWATGAAMAAFGGGDGHDDGAGAVERGRQAAVPQAAHAGAVDSAGAT
jgi:hypothetical protein